MMLAVMLAIAALMMAAAPAMAQGNHNDNNKNNDDNHFVRNFDRFDNNRFDNDDDFCDFFDCNFDRFDHFDNGFGDFEQEADSGDVAQSFQVINTGDNANQCAGITGNANTGNAQNQIGVTDFGTFNGFDRFDRNRFDGNPFFFDGFNGNGGDFGFEDTGADLTVTGTSTTTCDQQVNQAAAAG
jgi:hypothetical protein